jgi:hypothetical protein
MNRLRHQADEVNVQQPAEAAAPERAAALPVSSRFASIKTEPEKTLRRHKLASAIVAGGFRRIASDTYEATSGEDLGSIWVVADMGGEKWLVAYEDDHQGIVRAVKASAGRMTKVAAPLPVRNAEVVFNRATEVQCLNEFSVVTRSFVVPQGTRGVITSYPVKSGYSGDQNGTYGVRLRTVPPDAAAAGYTRTNVVRVSADALDLIANPKSAEEAEGLVPFGDVLKQMEETQAQAETPEQYVEESHLASVRIAAPPLAGIRDLVPFEEALEKSSAELKPGYTVEAIAEKHGVSTEEVEKALKAGIKIEMEHTKDKTTAGHIASQHLWEFIKYYDKKVGVPAMEKHLEETASLKKTADRYIFQFEGADDYQQLKELNSYTGDVEADDENLTLTVKESMLDRVRDDANHLCEHDYNVLVAAEARMVMQASPQRLPADPETARLTQALRAAGFVVFSHKKQLARETRYGVHVSEDTWAFKPLTAERFAEIEAIAEGYSVYRAGNPNVAYLEWSVPTVTIPDPSFKSLEELTSEASLNKLAVTFQRGDAYVTQYLSEGEWEYDATIQAIVKHPALSETQKANRIKKRIAELCRDKADDEATIKQVDWGSVEVDMKEVWGFVDKYAEEASVAVPEELDGQVG